MNEKEFFLANLDLMKKLNPERIFNIRLDLKKYFESWKNSSLAAYIQKSGSTKISEYAAKNPKDTLILLNDLLPGRINVIASNSEILSALEKVVSSGSLQD